MRPLHIYLIRTMSGLVKIGCAAAPNSRLNQLKQGASEELKLQAVYPFGSRALESLLHRHYRRQRVHGEWFDDRAGAVSDTFKDVYEKLAATVSPSHRLGKPKGTADVQLARQFGVKLQKARFKSGKTQVELAEALGVAEITVYFWERGKRTPTVKRIREIAKVLGCEPGDLL